ncbi:MAG: hypothetical protein HKN08_10785 [Gammaproteobacteria bacterium]|nr:hypothetical protein [Gammaproteobacteria bacterium]
MLNIITAFHTEALPLIEKFQLKKLAKHNVFDTYINDDHSTSLTISGLGKLNASAAVIHSANLFPESKKQCWVNLGIAGHHTIETGTLIIANKVIDESSSQNWYPQIIFETDIVKVPLTTIDTPTAAYPSESAVDMEASGFYSTASKVSTCELIHCLKIISDNEKHSFKSLDKQEVKLLIKNKIIQIEDILHTLKELTVDIYDSSYDIEIYQTLTAHIHFTHSEKLKLKNMLVKWDVLIPHNPLDTDHCIKLNYANKILKYLSDETGKQSVKF